MSLKQQHLDYPIGYKLKHAGRTIIQGVGLALTWIGDTILFIPKTLLDFFSRDSIEEEETKNKFSAILKDFHDAEQRRLERFGGKDPSKVLAGRKGGLKSKSKK